MTAPFMFKSPVTEQIPRSDRELLSDGSARMWSPITSSPMPGPRDAMLGR
jgi:hypothetical protein